MVVTTSTYLHFQRETEAAFNFYRTVFGTEFATPPVRFGDLPAMEDQPPLPEADKDLIMDIQLPITGGHVNQGNDVPAFMGPLTIGNNVDLMISPDTKAEADKLFAGLSDGAKIEIEMTDQPGGEYLVSLVDKFGINWMINVPSKQEK